MDVETEVEMEMQIASARNDDAHCGLPVKAAAKRGSWTRFAFTATTYEGDACA